MSAAANTREAIDRRDRELISAELAKFNHRIEEFEVWLALSVNFCMLCSNLTSGASMLRKNTSVYVIMPTDRDYPNGAFCTTHGMIGWKETADSPTLCTVSGEVEEAPKKRA